MTSLEHRGIRVLPKGIRRPHRPILAPVGVFEVLGSPDHIFETPPEAVAHARALVERLLEGDGAARAAAD